MNEFGVHINIHSIPAIDLTENGVFSVVQKIMVQMQETVDTAIINEIRNAAIEQGITDLYILDKRNITAALRKQIPMKVARSDTYSHTCPACSRLLIYDCFGKVGKFCRDCGQALDWSDAE